MNSKDTSVYGSHTNSHWVFFGYKPQYFPTETDKSVKLLKLGCWAFSFFPSFACDRRWLQDFSRNFLIWLIHRLHADNFYPQDIILTSRPHHFWKCQVNIVQSAYLYRFEGT